MFAFVPTIAIKKKINVFKNLRKYIHERCLFYCGQKRAVAPQRQPIKTPKLIKNKNGVHFLFHCIKPLLIS